jgi:hypothetical protein
MKKTACAIKTRHQGAVMEIITVEHFSGKKGDIFQVILPDNNVLEMVLSSVDLSRVIDFPGKLRDPFSVLFDGTKGFVLPQANYRVRHGSGWETDIFLVPIADLPDGSVRYQAIYS